MHPVELAKHVIDHQEYNLGSTCVYRLSLLIIL